MHSAAAPTVFRAIPAVLRFIPQELVKRSCARPPCIAPRTLGSGCMMHCFGGVLSVPTVCPARLLTPGRTTPALQTNHDKSAVCKSMRQIGKPSSATVISCVRLVTRWRDGSFARVQHGGVRSAASDALRCSINP